MVCFKITNGKVTRKFNVSKGTTFDSLRERITSLFPEVAVDDKQKDFHLHYTDKEGDFITISTDSEFQEVLSELPEDAVWKLHISDLTDEHKFPEDDQEESSVSQRSSSNFSFHPSYVPSRMRQLKRDLIPWRDPFQDPFFTQPLFPFCRPSVYARDYFEGMDREFERVLDEHAQILDSMHNAVENATGEGTSSSEKDLQPKMLGEIAARYPGAEIKNFGSWEPKEFKTPHGKGKIIGPVGYYVSWDNTSKKKRQKKD